MDSSADFKWSLLGARRAHQHRQAEPRRDPNRGTRPGGGRVCRARRPAITVGSFVATSGQKPWPSAGSFVAAYGQFFMAADIPARLFVGDLLLPEPVPVAHGVAVAPTETPPVDLEGTAPRLLPRRLVAQRPGPGVVRPGKGRHDPLSLSRFDHSYALADFLGRSSVTLTPCGRGLWRARCIERCTPGSGSGLRKRAGQLAGTAPQADFTDRPHQ